MALLDYLLDRRRLPVAGHADASLFTFAALDASRVFGNGPWGALHEQNPNSSLVVDAAVDGRLRRLRIWRGSSGGSGRVEPYEPYSSEILLAGASHFAASPSTAPPELSKTSTDAARSFSSCTSGNA